MSAGVGSMRGDATALCERLAAELRSEGARHPVAGAVALAARGREGLPGVAFAHRLGLPAALVASLEAGLVAWTAFPPELDRAVAALELDLLALIDLELAWAREVPGL